MWQDVHIRSYQRIGGNRKGYLPIDMWYLISATAGWNKDWLRTCGFDRRIIARTSVIISRISLCVFMDGVQRASYITLWGKKHLFVSSVSSPLMFYCTLTQHVFALWSWEFLIEAYLKIQRYLLCICLGCLNGEHRRRWRKKKSCSRMCTGLKWIFKGSNASQPLTHTWAARALQTASV